MNPQKIFREKLKGKLGRKLLASKGTYKLAKEVFINRNNFDHKARKLVTSMTLDQAAEAYHQAKPVTWTSAFFPSEMLYLFDMVPFAPEAAAGTSATFDLSPDLLK